MEIKLTFERTFRGKSPLVKLVYIAIMTHILQARVIMHVHDYYLKTCLLGPFKGVFGPMVGSGAPGEPNFTNNQTDPIFLIPWSLLNLMGQKKYTFDVRGQK